MQLLNQLTQSLISFGKAMSGFAKLLSSKVEKWIFKLLVGALQFVGWATIAWILGAFGLLKSAVDLIQLRVYGYESPHFINFSNQKLKDSNQKCKNPRFAFRVQELCEARHGLKKSTLQNTWGFQVSLSWSTWNIRFSGFQSHKKLGFQPSHMFQPL